MSRWVLPTTADVGIRAFSSDAQSAISEVTLGLQEVQTEEIEDDVLLGAFSENWDVGFPEGDLERCLIRWLEEVLFRGHGEGKWLTECELILKEAVIEAKVKWVPTDEVSLGIEVKAITMHELVMKEVGKQEVVLGVEDLVPSFEGPGWMAQVILDV